MTTTQRGTRFFVTSADGTRVAAWRNDGDGPPVIIANGLGTPPEAWPRLLDADCGLRVATFYYRGTGGGDRPADPSHVRVEDFVADLIAVMDAEGMERAVIAAWSIGVNVAFEALRRHPERFAGVLAVAGVPGGTFASMGAPLGIPRKLRFAFAVAQARALQLAGPAIGPLARAIPRNRFTARAVAHTGFMLPAATPEVVLPAVTEFVKHDVRWYLTLALGSRSHERMALDFVDVPVTFLAGRWDLLASLHDVVHASREVPDAVLDVLPGSHFLVLEYPDEVFAELQALVARTDLARRPVGASSRARKASTRGA